MNYNTIPMSYSGPSHTYSYNSYQQHQGPASMPVQFHSTGHSLKRKASGLTGPAPTCDICAFDDPILQVRECGHTFHTRCVNTWPLVHCPVCETPVSTLTVINVDMNAKIEQRSGKWTKQEEDFVASIIESFDAGFFPLANGTPVRLLLAKLLNCSPMRLSKKFQKNALGKRTYRVPKVHQENGQSYRVKFEKASYQEQMKRFSALEMKFRQHMVLLRKNDSTKQDGFSDLLNLSVAVRQFWASNFLKFAMVIGQKLDGIVAAESKKKKTQKLQYPSYGQILAQQQQNYSAFWDPTAMWKPYEGALEYSWKSDLGQKEPSKSSTVPMTPMGTRFAKKGSFDESIFELLGMDLDQSIEEDLFLEKSDDFATVKTEQNIDPLAHSDNSSPLSWEQILMGDIVGAPLTDPALQAWGNIAIY